MTTETVPAPARPPLAHVLHLLTRAEGRDRDSPEADDLRAALAPLVDAAPPAPHRLHQGHTVTDWGRFAEGIVTTTAAGPAVARERAACDAARLHALATADR